MVRTIRSSTLAALAAILASGGLSLVWVFLVPIFQAPDEPAHFDYTISIYSAGRLIRTSDGAPDWIVSPSTKYLIRATDFERIVEHSSMRVPPEYGTRKYFAKLDAGSPRLAADKSSSGRINYIVRLYPFAFYAFEALWMRAVSLFTSSLAAIFFSARIFCVLCMIAGLYFNYRTALNLGVPRWTSAALIAAIGLFPLTSYVSSYVQPDNLSYALVSAALFFATELRHGVIRLPLVSALGVSLGLLAVTKYQFVVSAAIAITALFAVRLMAARPDRKTAAAALALFVIPAAVLLYVQHAIVDSPSSSTTSSLATDANVGYLHGVIAQGLAAMLHYAGTMTLKAFVDCFVTGTCAATYWQVVGWSDTPIVLFNNGAAMAIRALISVASLACVFALAFFLARNALRLVALVSRGRLFETLKIAAGDPVINAYVCFTAIMVGLYVITNNAYGASGRHWYPYIFPAFLCFAWYLPRAFTKRYRAVSAVLTGTLLCYSLASASYALAGVTQRYYGPQRAEYVAVDPPASAIGRDRATGILWPVIAAGYPHVSRAANFTFDGRTGLQVSGVAVPVPPAQRSLVSVVLDGHATLPLLEGDYVFTVGEATHNIADGYSGFTAKIDGARLHEGAHTVVAYARRLDGRFAAIAPLRLFFLTAPDGSFTAPLVRALDRAAIVSGDLRVAGFCRGPFAPASSSVAQGSTLAITGAVKHNVGRYAASWLRVDDRPYPASYDSRDGSLAATIPTARLTPGLHRVVAYAIADDPERSRKISGVLLLRVVSAAGGNTYPSRPPNACRDPLMQLAAQ